jgi:hypothetical protein
MKFEDLQDGDVVKARWGRAGRERVNWSKWQDTPLYIEKYKGEIVTLALRNKDNWAEYSPRHQKESTEPGKPILLIAEDYYLEINLNL